MGDTIHYCMEGNRLGSESSPYLIQHADNPVHWYPWGDMALERATSENKPIFLSIGYSACHWCHVMAHESFEDTNIAEMMNANFVNIKVDREERPDIDAIYQAACQKVTGQGGWPLSVFMTPDQKPFYVGTYFPILDGYGRPGFGSILRQLSQAWHEKPGDIRRAADDFTAGLIQPIHTERTAIERPLFDEAAVNMIQAGDPIHGGFGDAPKFPGVSNISFLFRYSRISGIARFAQFGLQTLQKMGRGGIFDHIGGGFHRYSTDRRWFVPHFEKMLYDNALIPACYAEAYQITGEPFYRDVMERTLRFVLRDMSAPEGGFYSALDADSDGEEGRFYVWSQRQIRDTLGDDAKPFCMYYNIAEGGNWEGSNIPHTNSSAISVASACATSEAELYAILERCRDTLLHVREGRPRPGLDNKILTSWNGMMISALTRAFTVTGDSTYVEAATTATSFVMRHIIHDDIILRAHGTDIGGFLEDYAYMTSALLDIFCVRPDPAYVEAASMLGRAILERFWDGSGGFFMTPTNHESLIVRPRSEYDLAMPSGSSMAATALLRLYHITGECSFEDVAMAATEAALQRAAENPLAHGQWLNAAYMQMRGITEVVTGSDETFKAVSRLFIPETMIVRAHTAYDEYPLLAGKTFEGNETYVCRDNTCSEPILDTETVVSMLR